MRKCSDFLKTMKPKLKCLSPKTKKRTGFSGWLTDGVDLIHKDDAWLMVSGIVEHLSDQSGTFTDVLINDGAGHHLKHSHIGHNQLTAPQWGSASWQWYWYAPWGSYSPADWPPLWQEESYQCLLQKETYQCHISGSQNWFKNSCLVHYTDRIEFVFTFK